MKSHRIAAIVAVSMIAIAACSGGESSPTSEAGLKGAAPAGRLTVPPATRPAAQPGVVPPIPVVTAGQSTMPLLTKSPFSEPNVPNPGVANDQSMTIIALGDSYGSGEGNPVTAGSYLYTGHPIPGQPREKWSTSTDPSVQQNAERCHRSDQSGSAKAARKVASVNPPLTVNYVSFACSGAETKNIVETSLGGVQPEQYKGADADYFNRPPLPSQLSQAKQWLQAQPSKRADVVYISIGGNDVGFGTVVSECFIFIRLKLPWERCQDFTAVKAVSGQSTFTALTSRLQGLAREVRTAFPEALIVFSQYPDLLSIPKTDPRDRNKDGICSDQDAPPINDLDFIFSVRTPDAFWIRDVFQKKLNGTIDTAIKSLNLPRIVVASDHVNNQRGFCSASAIVNPNQDSLNRQGRDEDLAATWVAGVAGLVFNGTILTLTNLKNYLRLDFSKGGWHPNDGGYELYGQAIYNRVSQYDARVGDVTAVELWRMDPLAPDSIWKTREGYFTSLTSEPAVTISWNDRAFNEDSYLVTIKPASGPVKTVSLPAGSTSYEIVDKTIGKTPITVEVQACHAHNGKGGGTCSTAATGTL